MKLKSLAQKFLSFVLCVNLAIGSPVFAGQHPLTEAVFDRATGTTYIDQVMHIDWDINNPPTLVIEGVSTPLDRTYIRKIMESATDLLYTMTEGKFRLGKISVYSRQFKDQADIQLLNMSGRPNAHVDGLDVKGARNQNFTQPFGAPATVDYIGKTIAHEFGHYIFGLLDEYREVGNFDTRDPGAPQDRDTERPTIMNSQMDYSRFSTTSDYTDLTKRQTAQYRWFGKSAWELLVSDPATDSASGAKKDVAMNPRIWFDSFKGMPAPTTLLQPADTVKSRSSLQITYMSQAPTVAYVFDLNVTAAELDAFVKSAIASMNALPAGSVISTFIFSGQEFVDVGSLTLGQGTNDPARLASRAAWLSLPPVPANAATSSLLSGVLRSAAVRTSPLAKAFADAAARGQAAPLTTSVEVTSTPVIELFTTTKSTVDDPTLKFLASGAVMVNAELMNRGNGGNMEIMARGSRGAPVVANSAVELEKKVLHAIHSAIGDDKPTIASQKYDSFSAGAQLSLKFVVASPKIDGKVVVEAMVGKNQGMSLELKSPTGVIVNQATAASLGITYKFDKDEASLSFEIPTTFAGRTGSWTATLNAANNSLEPVEIEVETESKLQVDVAFFGGTKDDTRSPMMTATVVQPLIVKNASVTADIYDGTGKLIKAGIVLLDDGLGVDEKPGDGVYSAAIGSFLPASGDYDVEVHVTNANLLAAYGTGGALSAGVNAPDVLLAENFYREEGVDFAYVSAPPTAKSPDIIQAMSGGGGCTLVQGGPFDPLFPLLLAGAGFYLSRRRRQAMIEQ
jgi:hypothetical protein